MKRAGCGVRIWENTVYARVRTVGAEDKIREHVLLTAEEAENESLVCLLNGPNSGGLNLS